MGVQAVRFRDPTSVVSPHDLGGNPVPDSGLREHVTSKGWNMSLIGRLPLWMRSARSRDDVLAAVARLRARLGDTGR
jgi:hypothetical protein